ncbi:MAG TPA: apolipoprotein N-acyltransferase [Gammaproteobacteria bacterium]|nr:apolipoprotein N-acyltransferase [Gammaproteobacteria bacterium]
MGRLPRRLGKGLLALLLGALVAAGFAPLDWYPLPIVALAGLALLLYRQRPREALLYGWLFGLGEFGAGVSWVYISIYLYGHAGLALSIAVMLLLVMYLALYPAAMAWVLGRAGAMKRGWFFAGAFPAAWVLSEWLRSWVLTGFPWLNLGYSEVEGPLFGLAPLLGAYGVGWATALAAGLLAWFASGRGQQRLAAAGALVLLLAGGLALDRVHWTRPLGDPLRVTLVQGNIPQELKWKPDQQAATLERYLELTRAHLDSDLVVWPETAIPAFYDQVESDFLQPLRAELAQHGVSLVTGIPVLDRRRWRYYNSIISLAEPGRFYYKVHLVPFGEYLPLRDWLARVLSFLPVPEADFSSGTIDQPLLHAAGYPVGSSICYEIAFGEQLIAALPEAAFLINVSNDAWFGDSLAPHQHLEMARMRAREAERYLLRATNTGISAIIDADGRIAARTRQFRTETLSGEIQPRSGATPYVRWGNVPVIVGSLLLLLAAWRFGRTRS